MSATLDCSCSCPSPEVVLVPGSPGDPGDPCTPCEDGINSFTTLVSALTLPPTAGPVVAVVSVADSRWMSVKQTLFISDSVNIGHFVVTTIPDAVTVTLTWLDYPNDSAGGTPIGIGAIVSPGGVLAALAAPLPTAFTDNTTGSASNTLAAGAGVQTLAFFITATSIANGDLLTDYVPGYRFKILKFDARCATPVTTNAKASNLNLEIDSTNVTGGVIALSGTYAQGAAQAGTAVTANNVGTAAQALSIEAAATTAFVEGAFWLIISIQNMDTADALASLAAHTNSLIVSLT